MVTTIHDPCHPLEQFAPHLGERGTFNSEQVNDMNQDRSDPDNDVCDEVNIAIVAPAGDAAADSDAMDISNETPALLDDTTNYDEFRKMTDPEEKSTESQPVIANEVKDEISDSQNEHHAGQKKSKQATVESEDEENDAPIDGQKEKAKGKERVDATPDSFELTTVEDFLEMLTLEHANYTPSPNATEDKLAEERHCVLADPETRHRFIFSVWPRDPASKNVIMPENSVPGKMAPNMIQLWGATLLDFYYVQRHPGIKGLQTITTGSKMLGWVKMKGEEKYPDAMGVVQSAEQETEPMVIEPCDIARLIIDGEAAKRHGVEKRETMFPRTYPIESIFTADTYPKGWDREPFSKSFSFPVAKPPTLQKYIPQHLLPQKLVVHDPCNLLLADEDRRERQSYNVTHTYKLQPSTTYTERREADKCAQVQEEAKEKAIRDKFLADPHSRNTLPPGLELGRRQKREAGPVRPYIFYAYPLAVKPRPMKEAHLYLDMDHVMGEGNHSFVYSAVFELPRTFLVPPEVCRDCIEDDVAVQLQSIIKFDGSAIDPKFNEKTGKLVFKEEVHDPNLVSIDHDVPRYIIEPGYEESGLVYEGPYIVLQSRVRPQNPEEDPYCEHHQNIEKHPLTTRVKVAAKVSIQGDGHLPVEARNYQRFPRHFFEHWSGYNVILPIHDPVPLGPLVPQFYGYYTLDEEIERTTSVLDKKPYLSPILLLEDCGTQIKPEELSVDDVNECASLLFRFNHSMWAHQSVFSRNILMQAGPLSKWPLGRMIDSWSEGKKTHSFRLIDFGRSIYAKDLDSREREKVFMYEQGKVANWCHGFPPGMHPI